MADQAASPPPGRPGSPASMHPMLVRMVSSSLGSVATALAVTPLDVIKVRRQAAMDVTGVSPEASHFFLDTGLIHGERLLAKECSPHFSQCGKRPSSSLALPPSTQRLPPTAAVSTTAARSALPESTLRAVLHIYRAEGLPGIYAGLSPTLVMAVPATVLYFTCYDTLKDSLRPHLGSGWTPAVAGITARMFATAITSPFELVRTLSQSAPTGGSALVSSGGAASSSLNMVGEFRSMVRSGGVLSLWRGLEPTLWRDVPFSGIYWGILEASRARLRERWPSDHPMTMPLQTFASGALAGVVAAAVTTPFDVVKTRRQVFTNVATAHGTAHSAISGNGSTPEVMWAIAKGEGLGGLFRGFNARILKVAPACAIMISSYEMGKLAFGLAE